MRCDQVSAADVKWLICVIVTLDLHDPLAVRRAG